MISELRDFLNSDLGIVIQFVLLVVSIIQLTSLSVKAVIGNNDVMSALTLSLIVLLGCVLPVFVLIFSPWNGWIHIVLNILSIVALLNFLGLLYIMYSLNSLLAEINQLTKK